jgi:4-hydroxy-tetrahydrodipicolinate synthase
MGELRGTSPILTTPFTEEGAVDYDGLTNIVRKHVDEGCRSLTLFGLASEFYKLTDDERGEILAVVMETCADESIETVVSATHHATAVARERAARAEAAGADYLMVLPPFFLDPSLSDVYAHVERVADAVDIPVVVQYAPGPTGTTVHPELFGDLASAVENVDYYKVEATPPGPYVSRLLELTGGSVDVLVGNAGLQMLEAFDRGAVGVMPGSPLSDVYVEICDRYRDGRESDAESLFAELLPMLNHITQSPEMAFAYGKEILARRGIIDSAATRAPAFVPDEHHDQMFDARYEALSEHFQEMN